MFIVYLVCLIIGGGLLAFTLFMGGDHEASHEIEADHDFDADLDAHDFDAHAELDTDVDADIGHEIDT